MENDGGVVVLKEEVHRLVEVLLAIYDQEVYPCGECGCRPRIGRRACRRAGGPGEGRSGSRLRTCRRTGRRSFIKFPSSHQRTQLLDVLLENAEFLLHGGDVVRVALYLQVPS